MRIVSATKMAAAVAGASLLVACGGEEQSELRQELAAMTKDLRGRVDPLPQVKSYEPVPYKGESMVDPFVPGRIVVAQASKLEPTQTLSAPALSLKMSSFRPS